MHTPITTTICSTVMLLPSLTQAGQTRAVPEQYDSIQAAIAASSDGDRVLVGPGIWTGTIDTRNLAITIESSKGVSATILDADGSGS
ncbi:MAG: hypothetical protein MK101_10805, partial [Phycisphaerales bacterium]|nr:hypothetical protein [Phycisphaerales bacterium]